MNVATKVINAQILKDDYGWPVAGQQSQVAFTYAFELSKAVKVEKSFAANQAEMTITEESLGDDLPDVIDYQPFYWLNQAVRQQGLKAKPLNAVSFELSDEDEKLFDETEGDIFAKVEAVINRHFVQFEAAKYR